MYGFIFFILFSLLNAKSRYVIDAETKEPIENVNVFSRNFYFGDKDGDRIFTSYTGNPLKNARENVIIAGTGKYKGISGNKRLGIAM